MKNLLKKIICSTLVMAIILNMFFPLSVLAGDAFVITFNVEDSSVYTLSTTGGLGVDQAGEPHQKIDIMVGEADETNNFFYNCSNNVCTVNIPNTVNGTVWVRYNGNAFDLTIGETKYEPETPISSNTTLTVKAPSGNQNPPPIDPNQPDPNQPDPNQPNSGGSHFDGHAYLIWACKNHEGVCFKHYTDIHDTGDGSSNFIKASTVIDDRTNESFDVNVDLKGWSTDAKFDEWVRLYKMYKGIPEANSINWAEVDPKDMIGDPEDVRPYEDKYATVCNKPTDPMAPGSEWDAFQSCVNEKAVTEDHKLIVRAQLQPVGEPQEKNAYVSYGDRNFKAVIYNDDYKGVSIGSLDDLHYYPSTWANPFLRRDQYDISDTAKDKPTGIDVNILENIVNIKTLDYNGFNITALEALDVSEKAVEVSKVDNEWRIKFNSNFYDHVVFKATDSNNKESYFQIKRTTVDPWIRHGENHKPIIIADFYFDRTKSYSDYDLTAKIIYKDGTEKMVKLNAVKRIDDGLGNITPEYEVDEETPVDPEHNPNVHGRGLKHSSFEYELEEGEDQKIKTFYVYVENKGSTDKTYAGTVAGSGKGVKANLYDPEEDH